MRLAIVPKPVPLPIADKKTSQICGQKTADLYAAPGFGFDSRTKLKLHILQV